MPSAEVKPLAKAMLNDVHADFHYPAARPANQGEMRKGQQIDGGRKDNGLPKQFSQLVVELPQPSHGFRREDYAVVPAFPKRKTLAREAREAEATLRLRTQQEQEDEALMRFQDLLLEIFEYQDRLEEELRNQVSPTDNEIFETPDEDDDFQLRLSQASLDKLNTSLKELLSMNRLEDLSVDHVKRLQRLCKGSIEGGQSLNIRIDTSALDDPVAWTTNIRKANIAACSAIALLYTVLGSLTEETASSTEILRLVPDMLVNVLETCLIPIIESRPDGQEKEIYQFATHRSDELKRLLESIRKTLDILTSACVEVQSASECVNATEFLAAKLIFVQNAATDKTAALGVQAFERVRKQAMASLLRIYAAYTAQRAAILDEVLSSLGKLPSTSSSARQYKLVVFGENKNIMLVTVLLLQIVQTSSVDRPHSQGKRKCQPRPLTNGNTHTVAGEESDDSMEVDDDASADQDDDMTRLQRKAGELFDPASTSAQAIVLYLVGKASTVTKTGGSPYRNVLDWFIEDLISLLQDPAWPAAELLLRIIAAKMTDFVLHEKAVSTKNMALEGLGKMASGISAVRASTQSSAEVLARETEPDEGERASLLIRLANEQGGNGLRSGDLFDEQGPFGVVCRYHENAANSCLRARSARSFYLAQYAQLLCVARKNGQNVHERSEDESIQAEAAGLLEQIADASSDHPISGSQNGSGESREAPLAYLLGILNLGFCRRYEQIVRTLLSSLSSDQAQVRSRSVKEIVTILETDPSLLDRDPTISEVVFSCASDDSAMVRDAALSLIAKFVISKPALEEKGIKKLLECAEDDKVGVQKRAIGLLADVYTQDARPKLKAAIAQTILRRTADVEDSVNELAKRTLTDIWITPNLLAVWERSESVKAAAILKSLTSYLVETVQCNPGELAPLLTKYLKWLLKATKSSEHLGRLVGNIVGTVFQSIIEGQATTSSLQVLMSLADARPESVGPLQLQHLKQYLSFISNKDDLPMFKSVIGIYRHVLPHLSSSHDKMLNEIQQDLMASINKLGRRIELDEVMSCLRIIDGVLPNGFRFVRLLASVMNQICNQAVRDTRRVRLLRIAGAMAKHLNLEELYVDGQIPAYRGGPVSGFLVDMLYPFAAQSGSGSEPVQLVAFESLGAVCQSWPARLNDEKVLTLLIEALNGKVGGKATCEKIQVLALKILEELYDSPATVQDDLDQGTSSEQQIQDLKKIGGSAKAQDDNSAVSSTAVDIHPLLVQIAFRNRDEKALLALRTIAHMAQRGMLHPKDYAGVLIALETSSETEMRLVAEKTHALLHQQHESHWDREYTGAVQQAFKYQQTQADSQRELQGIWLQDREWVAKLSTCFNVINRDGTKPIKRFLGNLVTLLSTDFDKIDTTKTIPDHVLLVRFLAQNLAYFEYTKVDDLLHTLSQLEIVFSRNGSEVSQAIEMSLPPKPPPPPVQADAPNPVDLTLLRKLASAACAVTLLSETKMYLKQRYGISNDIKAVIQQNKQAKESTKPPTKVHGISGERYLQRTASIFDCLEVESNLEQCLLGACWQFHGLMSVDEEVRVDEDLEARDSLKRKSAGSSAGGTPKRPRGRPRKK